MKKLKVEAIMAKNKLKRASMRAGEQAQPGALGKGIGLIVGGAVLCALKAIVTAIIGTDPTTMTFY